MRIMQIAPPWYPVPPTGYGGIEWIVSSLADDLTALGHEVTLVANGDSETSADLISVFDGSDPQRLGDVRMEAAHAVSAHLHASDVDIIHDHTGVIGPAMLAHAGRPGGDGWRRWAGELRRRFRDEFWVEDALGPYPAGPSTRTSGPSMGPRRTWGTCSRRVSWTVPRPRTSRSVSPTRR